MFGDGSEPLNLAGVEHLIFASGASFELRTEWSEEWEKADARVSVGDLVDRLRAVCTVAPNVDDELLN